MRYCQVIKTNGEVLYAGPDARAALAAFLQYQDLFAVASDVDAALFHDGVGQMGSQRCEGLQDHPEVPR